MNDEQAEILIDTTRNLSAIIYNAIEKVEGYETFEEVMEEIGIYVERCIS